MAIEIPARFDEKYTFIGPSVRPLNENLLAYAAKKVPKLEPVNRAIVVETFSQVDLIPPEEFKIVAYDLEQLAIDKKLGLELLKTQTLSRVVSEGEALITHSRNRGPTHLQQQRVQKEIFTTHVAKMRIGQGLDYVPGTEEEVVKGTTFQHTAALVQEIIYSSDSPAFKRA